MFVILIFLLILPNICHGHILFGQLTSSNKLAAAGIQTLFAGNKTITDSSGNFELSLFEMPDTNKPFYILACQNTELNHSKKATNKLGPKVILKKETPHKLFVIRKSADGKSFLEKQSLEKLNYQLPAKRTLIININPKYVDDNQDKNITKLSTIKSSLRLPAIKLYPAGKLTKPKTESSIMASCSNKPILKNLTCQHKHESQRKKVACRKMAINNRTQHVVITQYA